jgi:hypothetical protein
VDSDGDDDNQRYNHLAWRFTIDPDRSGDIANNKHLFRIRACFESFAFFSSSAKLNAEIKACKVFLCLELVPKTEGVASGVYIF